MDKILITAKVNPDLDGVACIAGYQELLSFSNSENVYVCGVSGEPHVEAKYLLERFKVQSLTFDEKEDFDNFILVDMSDSKGLPRIVRLEDVSEVIDHRSFAKGKELFPNAKIQVEMVGAAATLIVEKYMAAAMNITFNSAILFYGAIFSNTLNFKAGVTTDRDKKAIEWIESNIEIPKNLIEDMFEYKTQKTISDIELVLRNDGRPGIDINGKVFGILQLEVLGARKIAQDKRNEILAVMRKFKSEFGLDGVFLTMPDIKEGYHIFMCDNFCQEMLAKAYNIKFNDGIAEMQGVLLRKEIIPTLRGLM